MFPSRILIVEDEDVFARNLKTFLSRSAGDVRIAPDADSAMAILESFTPDLVVLDYGLPGIDGLRAYEKITRFSQKPPRCVLISGELTEVIANRARQHGIRQTLCKPFSFAELQKAVDASTSEVDDTAIVNDRRVNERRSYRTLWCRLDRRLKWNRRKQQVFRDPTSPLQGHKNSRLPLWSCSGRQSAPDGNPTSLARSLGDLDRIGRERPQEEPNKDR